MTLASIATALSGEHVRSDRVGTSYDRDAKTDYYASVASSKRRGLRRYRRRTTIFNEGDPAQFGYRIVEGIVRLLKITTSGERHILEFLMPDDFFGFEDGDEFVMTAEAASDCVLEIFPPLDMWKGSASEGNKASSVVDSLRNELRHSRNHIMMLGRRTAQQKLASFLLQMYRRGTQNDGVIHIPLTRGEIADYLGLTIETVCRVITALKTDRVIDVVDRNSILVRNLTRLQQIAE